MKRYFTGCLLIFIGTWFLWLWQQGNLDFYILPRFNVLVIFTGLSLGLFGIVLLLARKPSWHEIRFHLPAKAFIPFLLLVSLVVIFPPQPLSSQSVTKRGIDTDLSQIRLTTPINFDIDSRQRTFADWIKILSTSPNPIQYANQPAQVTGFVYREDDQPADEFYLARFLIRCCSADARPVVLRVKSPNAANFNKDDWLQVQGTFDTDDNAEQPLFLKVDSYQIVPIPDTPYIY